MLTLNTTPFNILGTQHYDKVVCFINNLYKMYLIKLLLNLKISRKEIT